MIEYPIVSQDAAGIVTRTLPARPPEAHNHSASNITSGAFDIARIPTGSTSSTVCIGNDSRLSDARTPIAHDQAWSTITSTPTTLVGYGITDGQKTITSGTAAPSGGVDGDIYLQYV